MKESEFVRLLKKNLLGVFHKNYGSAFGTAGLPDLEGCIKGGRSCIIEAKMGKLKKDNKISLRSPLTKIQKYWLSQYKYAGALSLIAIYLEDIHKAVFFQVSSDFPELDINQQLRDITFLSPKFIETKVLT